MASFVSHVCCGKRTFLAGLALKGPYQGDCQNMPQRLAALCNSCALCGTTV